jgi:hypothetical protein
MLEIKDKEQTVHWLANQFRQTEIQRVGGREFACRVYKLEQFIDLLNEDQARDLAFKIFHSRLQPELTGYLLTWFDGMGFGQYSYKQVLENIGDRQATCLELEPFALWN